MERTITDLILEQSSISVRDLMRMKRVFKFWKTRIEEEQFISQQMNRGKWVLFLGGFRPGICNIEEIEPHEEKIECNDLSFLRRIWNPMVSFVGSCNGIICFQSSITSKFHVVNPSLRKRVATPPAIPLERKFMGLGIFDGVFHILIVGYQEHSSLYDMASNCWQQIEAMPRIEKPNQELRSKEVEDGAFFNSSLYWVSTDMDRKDVIIKFDLKSRNFGKWVVDSLEPSMEAPLAKGLYVVNNNLCLMKNKLERPFWASLWLSRDGRCWKHWFAFNFCGFTGLCRPVHAFPNKEVLLNMDGMLLAFVNIESGNVRMIGRSTPTGLGISYQESLLDPLLLVGRGRIQERRRSRVRIEEITKEDEKQNSKGQSSRDRQ